MAIKVLFHSFGNGHHCPDGFAAAYVAWKQFGDNAEYIPCVHQQPPPGISKGDLVFLLDFSYPRAVLEEWSQVANVFVYDHHKTAQAELEGLPRACFDMNRSGAQLAWLKWFSHEPEPVLIRYVADRDLWKKELPYTEEIHRALVTFPQDFYVWDTLAGLTNYVDFMRRIGEPLYRQHLADVEELIEEAVWKTFAGHDVLCTHTQNNSLVSDALNLICQRNPETPFALNWWPMYADIENEYVKFELRSVGDFDVSAIAKQLGGGGHKNAAGCGVSVDDPRIADFV